MSKTKWEVVDKNWYCSDLGGIAKEKDRRWWFYPKHLPDWGENAQGPFKTLEYAKRYARKYRYDRNSFDFIIKN